MERIILVRHGQTNKNTTNTLHKVNDEEYLNDVGKEQIRETTERLKDFSPSKVYSSKGERALESGQIISEGLGIILESIDGIEERNWGDFAGKTWDEVSKVLNPMSLEERYLYTPPNGESWKDFETRLIRVVTKILEENKGKTIVVVSHGGAIRALMPYFLNRDGDESFKHNPDNASITIFDHDNGEFSLVLVNNTEHLK